MGVESPQEYRDRVVPVGSVHGSWVVIDNTTSSKKSRGVLCRCSCGYEKKVYIADLINKRSTSCLSCSRKSKAYQQKRLNTFRKNSKFTKGQQIGSWTVLDPLVKGGLVFVECVCGTRRTVQPGNLLREKSLSCGCQYSNTSRAELELKNYLLSLGLDAEKKQIDGIEIDLVVDEKKVGFECNGLYWHSEVFKKDKKYHLNKTLVCEKAGYRLVHIREDWWQKRQSQVKSFLRSLLGKNENRVYARNCHVVPINKLYANAFLDRVHIQGKDNRAVYCLGLVSKDTWQVQALATFSKHPRNSQIWTLSRFACRDNVTVVGGLSRLSKAGLAATKAPYLVSWADRSISQARGYLSAGWSIDAVLPSDYVYVKGSTVVSKQSRKKSNVGTPEGMTEREHAFLEGYARLWDCGKIKLTFSL